jgi:hypothetical protein
VATSGPALARIMIVSFRLLDDFSLPRRVAFNRKSGGK